MKDLLIVRRAGPTLLTCCSPFSTFSLLKEGYGEREFYWMEDREVKSKWRGGGASNTRVGMRVGFRSIYVEPYAVKVARTVTVNAYTLSVVAYPICSMHVK